MPQLRTAEEFTAFITSDLTWRIHEISDIRSTAATASLPRAILRASVPLMYAHWEGHVSVVSRAYLDFLALRRLRYSNLKQSFRLNAFFTTIRRMTQARASYMEQVAFLSNVVDSGESQPCTAHGHIIPPHSTLYSSLLPDICCFFR